MSILRGDILDGYHPVSNTVLFVSEIYPYIHVTAGCFIYGRGSLKVFVGVFGAPQDRCDFSGGCWRNIHPLYVWKI